MEVRRIREDEQEAAFYLSSQAFGQGERDSSRLQDPNRLPHDDFGVWDEAGLQAKVAVVQYRAHFGPDAVLPMGGIAGVACLPASRGKGYAGTCLKYTLERMREAGQVISGLYPFSYAYYRRLGWEWVGDRREYKVPTDIMQPSPETEKVRAALPGDRDSMIGCYALFAARYRGMIQRDEKNWNRILSHSAAQFRFTYLYEHEGRTEGYLTYLGGERTKTKIREFIVLTPRARQGLLGLLRRHEMQIELFQWEGPGDDTLWSTLFHNRIETSVEPSFMGRVVDVPGALAAWKPAAANSGRLIFHVRDEAAPWNEGTWLAEFEAGNVRIVPTDRAPQISLDIQALSQAYFGTPTVSALRAAERITVHDETGYTAFQSLFAGPPMWINDFF